MNEPESQPLSDADLIAWSVIFTHRAQRQRDGINVLLLPYPRCPTCSEPVYEAEQVTRDHIGIAGHSIRLTLKPCGHVHTASEDDVHRLWLYIYEMVRDVASGYHGYAVEARTWTTDEVVREARSRAAGTATEGDSYPPPGCDENLESLRAHAADVSRKTGLDVTVEPSGGQYALAVAHPIGQARHGGYSFDAVHGMLLGIAAAADTVAGCRCHNGEEVHPHPECPVGAGGKPSIEDVVRLEGALHVLRFVLDRAIRTDFKPAPEYLRELLDRATGDPGEPCDRDQQYARAEAAEAGVARVRAETARIRATTPTWGPVADLIDAALDDPGRLREQRMRPTHPDGTPYSYCEITAEGWGFCDGCRMWSTATPDRPHQCAETHMQGPIDGKENGDV